jgi:glutamate-1-semialdehyde 2,1-aminomutase
MSAIRLARAYTGKDRILTFEGMYHGHNDDVLVNVHPAHTSLGTRRNATKVPESNGVPAHKLDLVESVPWNDADLLAERLERRGDQIAAIITEAVMSNSGLVWPADNYLDRLQQLAHKHDVLFILDEVVTGFRMSLGGAQAHFGLEPDLAVYGKALSNGYPNAALTGREEVMRFLKAEPDKATFMGTFSGNPLVVAATHANLERLSEYGEAGYDELHRKAKRLTTGLREVLADSPHATFVPEPAGFFFLHFTDGEADPKSWQDWREVDAHTVDRKYEAFAAAMSGEGVFFPPKVGRINLMHAHEDEHLERALEAAKVAIEAVPS